MELLMRTLNYKMEYLSEFMKRKVPVSLNRTYCINEINTIIKNNDITALQNFEQKLCVLGYNMNIDINNNNIIVLQLQNGKIKNLIDVVKYMYNNQLSLRYISINTN